MMRALRRRRLYAIIIITAGVALAIGLALSALKQDIDLYLTPSQIAQGKVIGAHSFRLGGLVKKGTLQREQGLQVVFVVTDFQHDISVRFNGVLPSLFREGQGIVVEGRLDEKGLLIADQVLAKHDENYKPPGVITSRVDVRKSDA